MNVRTLSSVDQSHIHVFVGAFGDSQFVNGLASLWINRTIHRYLKPKSETKTSYIQCISLKSIYTQNQRDVAI